MLGYLSVFAGLASLVLAVMVVIGGASARDGKWSFVGFASTVGLWAVGVGIFSVTTSEAVAAAAVYLYYIAALFIAYTLMVFCVTYGASGKPTKGLTYLALLPALAVAAIIYPLDGLVASIDVATHSVVLSLPAYLLYGFVFCLYVGTALWSLWRQAVRKKKLYLYRLLALSLSVSIVGGGSFNLILPGFGVYEYVTLGPLFTFVMVAAVFYAIARHGLFDIRFAVVRTMTYGLSIITLTGLYLVIAFFLIGQVAGQQMTISQQILNVMLVLALAFVFQPVKNFFDKITSKLFYKDNYSMGAFISQLNRALNSTNDLRTLLERTAEVIATTLKSEQVFSLVHLQEGHYVTAGTDNHSRVSVKEFEVFTEGLSGKTEVVIISDLDAASPARRMMVSHKLELVMPLYKGDTLVGFLCLGGRKAFRYSMRDIRALLTISDELTIAVQNALSVEEVRQLNNTLEARVSAATKELRASNAQLQRLDEAKDEFISMASHQLRTPLTSIKGYLSMLIEGDVGEVTNEQRKLLSEAFVSSERMVRLIGDFLNVSRLQTGKFVIEKHPVDLSLLVQRELDGLTQNASARGLTFKYTQPKKLPLLELDENKIQQVVMNFCDNAIYYSKENGTITVTLRQVKDEVEFKVTDTGIGVPKEEQSHLFNKFFRATNARRARPDGTGVGLFLAKRVIDDHKGSIIFESKEGKGSTFGFRLPVPKKG